MDTVEQTDKPLRFRGIFKKPSKKLFWAWIAYQCVKGTTTATLIWAPLIYAWFHYHH